MMSQKATIYWTKAQENLASAELLLANGRYNACANRAYYAALQASIVALLNEGYTVEKIDHALAQGDFVGKLIHRKKIYPQQIASYLDSLRQAREDADYKLKMISEVRARRQVTHAVEFLHLIRQRITE
jgi:uncharacterized protein (UPF0332 family)